MMEGLCFYFFQIPGNKQRVLNFMRDPKLAHILVLMLPGHFYLIVTECTLISYYTNGVAL